MPARYKAVAKKILPSWEISLAFVSPAVAKRLNKKLRGKSYTPNVLAYQAGPKSGEVLICKSVSKKEAAAYAHIAREHEIFLFIHALLHLKGMAHGSTMEKREQMLLLELGARPRARTNGTKNLNRHRHRHLSSQGRRRRRDRG